MDQLLNSTQLRVLGFADLPGRNASSQVEYQKQNDYEKAKTLMAPSSGAVNWDRATQLFSPPCGSNSRSITQSEESRKSGTFGVHFTLVPHSVLEKNPACTTCHTPRRLEAYPPGNLNVPGPRDTSIPHPERWASHVGVKRGRVRTKYLALRLENVPVKEVKKLRPELEIYAFCNRCPLDQREVQVVIRKGAQIRDARTLPKVEAEAVGVGGILEGCYIEQWLTWIKVAR